MPQYKKVNLICYCGKEYPCTDVGKKIKCPCGVTLHTQQKRNGTGRVWGTVQTKESRARMIAIITSGKSKLEATFLP